MKDTNNFYVATYQEPTYAVDIINKIQTEFFNYFKENKKIFWGNKEPRRLKF